MNSFASIIPCTETVQKAKEIVKMTRFREQLGDGFSTISLTEQKDEPSNLYIYEVRRKTQHTIPFELCLNS